MPQKIKELKKWYHDELKRRDSLIDELKKENMLLLKTALEKSEEKIAKKKVLKTRDKSV